MKMPNRLNGLLVALLVLCFTSTMGQESNYKLTPLKKIETSPTIDIKRVGSCWSNAGSAFLEAEWLRTGKEMVDISNMNFVQNAYLNKAEKYLDANSNVSVSEKGMAYDVVELVKIYGMAPESAYMYPSQDMNSKDAGQMDAILRGTLRLVKENQNEQFTENWQSTYNTALMRYIGDTKMDFKYNEKDYTPLTFAAYSGLLMDDYVLIGSDSEQKMNALSDIEFTQNWAQNKFYNVALDELVNSIKNSINGGYTVLWYGDVNEEYVFEDEGMAIVPAGGMPGVKTQEGEEAPELKPVSEKEISVEMRSQVVEELLETEQEYLLIYGINQDQDGNEYFEGKYVCKSGDVALNLSSSFVKLNTIYLMMNKNGLPETLKGKLGL